MKLRKLGIESPFTLLIRLGMLPKALNKNATNSGTCRVDWCRKYSGVQRPCIYGRGSPGVCSRGIINI